VGRLITQITIKKNYRDVGANLVFAGTWGEPEVCHDLSLSMAAWYKHTETGAKEIFQTGYPPLILMPVLPPPLYLYACLLPVNNQKLISPFHEAKAWLLGP